MQQPKAKPAEESVRFNEAPAGGRGMQASHFVPQQRQLGFNEAPAGGRGMHWLHAEYNIPKPASMRPRREAGECEG
ncbi:hypothetical protein MKLM6_2403 [Methylomonas koyamae]|nr:hypothetical protein MKLM6_2403 [Methylomonas koyamae]